MAEPILFTIPSLSFIHLNPEKLAIIAARAAAKIRAIWFEPARVSSPKNLTLKESRIIRNTSGMSDGISPGSLLFINLIVFCQRGF